MTFPSDEAATLEAEYVDVKVQQKGIKLTFEVPIEGRARVEEVLGLPPGDGSVRVFIIRRTTDWP